MSMLGAFIILLAICISVVVVETVSEHRAKEQRKNRYVRQLEQTVLSQQRSLQHYRFRQFMKDTEELYEKE